MTDEQLHCIMAASIVMHERVSGDQAPGYVIDKALNMAQAIVFRYRERNPKLDAAAEQAPVPEPIDPNQLYMPLPNHGIGIQNRDPRPPDESLKPLQNRDPRQERIRDIVAKHAAKHNEIETMPSRHPKRHPERR